MPHCPTPDPVKPKTGISYCRVLCFFIFLLAYTHLAARACAGKLVTGIISYPKHLPIAGVRKGGKGDRNMQRGQSVY
jgi:hypothetical protein